MRYKIKITFKNIILILTLFFLTFSGTGCRETNDMFSKKPAIQKIIASLKSENLEERKKALKDLHKREKQGLTPQEGLLCLQAADDEYPPQEYDSQDSSADLITAAASVPQAEYIPIIRDSFLKYNPKARGRALILLNKIPDRQAAVTFMGLLKTHARSVTIDALSTGLLHSDPKHADIFFPALLDYADIETFEWDIYHLLLTYFEENLVSTESLLPYSKTIVDSYLKYKDPLTKSQKTEGIDWMWEDDYPKWRDIASLILDVMGYFPTPEVESELHSALNYQDPRLKLFAALSLLRHGKEVDSDTFHTLAASAETRNILYDKLTEMNKQPLYPEEFKTQEAFAESAMVTWLIFPTELGRVPNEIECMKKVSYFTKKEGIIDYFVFRFRTFEPHWAAEDGWMAGIAGPYLRKEEPSTKAYGGTFSEFESWESKTAEEHVQSIADLPHAIPVQEPDQPDF